MTENVEISAAWSHPSEQIMPEWARGGASSDADVDVRKNDNECSSSHDSIHVGTLLDPPHKPMALQFFHSIEFVAIVASLRLAGTQLVPLVVMPIHDLTLINIILRIYITLFCIGVCLIELERPRIILPSPLLQHYLTRGLLYTFLALVAMNDANVSGIQDMQKHEKQLEYVPWTAVFTEMVAWPLFLVGHAYMLMGLCCMNSYRERLSRTYQEEVEEYQETMREYNESDDDEEELLKHR